MPQTAQIDTAQRNGNLHVTPAGFFSRELAQQLTATISRLYRGTGNIFIHTDALTGVAPESREALSRHIDRSGLPNTNLFFMGPRGFDINPDTCRVIAHKEKRHTCCGKCRNCSCQKNGEDGRSTEGR